MSLPGLPRVSFVTTRLAERQICHYQADREADLALPRLPRGRSVLPRLSRDRSVTTAPAESQICQTATTAPAERQSVTTALAERQICHYRACREADLSLPRLLMGRSVTTALPGEGDLSLPSLPGGRSVTIALAERQICHYRACRVSNLSLPEYRACREADCHYRACREIDLSLLSRFLNSCPGFCDPSKKTHVFSYGP